MPFGEPHGSTYLGDGGGWETPAQEAAREREDAITDAALDKLAGFFYPERTFYVECPGCLGLVHHSDREEHARTCEPLRAFVEGQV
jgi:hypothetical protein